MESTTAITPYLPREILMDILSRLSVTLLLQLKAVCKDWQALLDDHIFIRVHINRSIQDNRFSIMINSVQMAGMRQLIPVPNLFSVNFSRRSFFTNAVEVEYPFKADTNAAMILGSCDGILLVGVYDRVIGEWDPIWGSGNQLVFSAICLWNPATKEYKVLPNTLCQLSTYKTLCYTIAFGFGYDPTMHDYKVIRILYYYNNYASEIDNHETDVHLYTMQSNSCKKMPETPYFIQSRKPFSDIVSGTYLNGAIHWVGTDTPRGKSRIICFDLSKEEYREIPLPNLVCTSLSNITCGVLEECLSVCCVKEDGVDVFIMKEYGGKKYWNNALQIKQLVPLRFESICGGGKGIVLLQRGYSKLIWYDPNLPYTVYPWIGNLPGHMKTLFQMESYVHSLVPLKANTFLNRHCQKI